MASLGYSMESLLLSSLGGQVVHSANTLLEVLWSPCAMHNALPLLAVGGDISSLADGQSLVPSFFLKAFVGTIQGSTLGPY